MKKIYPKIVFIYSLPYDRLLTEYEGRKLYKDQIIEIQEYIKKIQPLWDKVNEKVCREIFRKSGLEWKEEQINCYVVKYCRYSALSNPLTLRKEEDFDLVISALIHELIHIILMSNQQKYNEIFKKIKTRFSTQDSDPRFITHIIVNFIQLEIIKNLFGKNLSDKVISEESKFVELKKAWKIVLKNQEELTKMLNI